MKTQRERNNFNLYCLSLNVCCVALFWWSLIEKNPNGCRYREKLIRGACSFQWFSIGIIRKRRKKKRRKGERETIFSENKQRTHGWLSNLFILKFTGSWHWMMISFQLTAHLTMNIQRKKIKNWWQISNGNYLKIIRALLDHTVVNR